METKIENWIEQAIEPLGLELIDVEVVGKGGRTIVRVYVDQPGGVTIDLCTRASRDISRLLDVHDPFKSRYVLEVSSPGIDRPLKTKRDYERNTGRLVKCRYKLVDGSETVSGRIIAVDDAAVHLDTETGERSLSIEKIELAKVVLEF